MSASHFLKPGLSLNCLNSSVWSDNSSTITASDIVTVVNYVFKSGSSPYPVPAAGDANCSGTVNASDLIAMVNFVFKSGSLLCDVETECSIDYESWTCP